MSVSDVVCTCGATPERDSFGNAMPCMHCYFNSSRTPEFVAGFRAGIEAAAKLIASKAELYPVDVFPEHSKSVDGISAGMGRHCAKRWSESIRALMPGGDNG